MSTEFSENGKSDSSDSSKNEPLEIDKLEAQELAKHRIRHLIESNEEYCSLYDCFLQWHYLIVSVCGVVALFGIIIAILKFMEKEILLDGFRLLQSSFASIISGGGIIALGSNYFFLNKDKDESKSEPKDEVIQLYFFGLLLDIKYLDVGLDILLSLTGIYYLVCECILKPYASKDRHWIKEVYLSPDKKVEIAYLLCGLNPDISLLRVNKFYKELRLSTATEKTPLLLHTKKSIDDKSEFIESVNDIEYKANRQIFEEFFYLGAVLAKCLGGEVPSKYSQRETEYKEIIDKFSFIKSDVEKIRKHYIVFDRFRSGLTLVEFFDKYPKQKHEKLLPEVIEVAHNALKVYYIFSKIGEDKI
ncbi:hypothetical protein C1646_669105 [Rhizophagus diaphanus]|nr:hypothetical protein C1646_669105 [Rhizophagus diaphanus] [Rhizophagus sp. MUCL 43196]